ncbi:hypothetical protein GCM10017600_10300 [Streptosporangium carneum]|uniref:Uncharacterized protein n=1 Tax=Streptosporangium carneum TaxID=47481 RepID=A0A9W6HYA5_9ACTN|nr:hypothetical protein GCM10017600_10300 [Streptosporangium carneum]
MQGRDLRDARVSRSTVDFGDLGVRRQRPAQGMLTPAGSNHKNAHLRELIGRERATRPQAVDRRFRGLRRSTPRAPLNPGLC